MGVALRISGRGNSAYQGSVAQDVRARRASLLPSSVLERSESSMGRKGGCKSLDGGPLACKFAEDCPRGIYRGSNCRFARESRGMGASSAICLSLHQ